MADTLQLSTRIVSSFIRKTHLGSSDLPRLLIDVSGALAKLSAPDPERAPPQAPAVSIRMSVKPDSIFCLECGKPFRSIKRHLLSAHSLTSAAYREKWSLKKDYPMVAPNFAATRSALAKAIGLGARGRVAASTEAGLVRHPAADFEPDEIPPYAASKAELADVASEPSPMPEAPAEKRRAPASSADKPKAAKAKKVVGHPKPSAAKKTTKATATPPPEAES